MLGKQLAKPLQSPWRWDEATSPPGTATEQHLGERFTDEEAGFEFEPSDARWQKELMD